MQDSTAGRVVVVEKAADGALDGPVPRAVGTAKVRAARASMARLDAIILVVAAFIVLVTTSLLFFAVITQVRTYERAIAAQLKVEKKVDHSAVLAYARSTDFAVAKLSALFLGFLLIFLGAMFVLRVAQTDYALSLASSEKRQLAFSTSSPGLAMITLGVLLIVAVLFSQSTVDYRPPAEPVIMQLSEDEAD